MNVKLVTIAEPTEDCWLPVCFCELAGAKPNGAESIIRSLVPGTELRLSREPENEHDPLAVRVDLPTLDDANEPVLVKVGYLPQKTGNKEAALVSQLLGAGIALECIVRQLNDPEKHVRQYITLAVYMKRQ